MNLNKCDNCGKETRLHPPTEPQFEKKSVPYKVPLYDENGQVVMESVEQKDAAGQPIMKPVYKRDRKGKVVEKDGSPVIEKHEPLKVPQIKYEEKHVEQLVPKMVKTKAKHPHTHEEIETEVQELKDLMPRALFLQCRIVGRDTIERDFCTECFDKLVKPKFAEFMNFLKTFERK